LREICIKDKPDVFYPIEDEILTLCVKHPEAWQPYTKAILPSPEALDCAYDKWKTIQFAQELGIPVPKTYCPQNTEEVASIASEWVGEAVIKPRKSSGSRGLVYVKQPAQIVNGYEMVSRKYPRPLIQERIPAEGQGLGCFTLLNEHYDTLAIFGHMRLREFPIDGGPSTLRKSYRDDAIIEQTIRLFNKMKLVGVAMAEYKIDKRTNEAVLLEINPRFWGSLQLSIHAGVNFPYLYFKTVLGEKVKPVLEYPSEKYCRWLWPGDILHFFTNSKRFSLQPSFFRFFDKDLTYDIISPDDPLPMVGTLLEAVRKLYNKHLL
jgi:predicted ATP-grasp superfamily ATP-dependent carboligase